MYFLPRFCFRCRSKVKNKVFLVSIFHSQPSFRSLNTLAMATHFATFVIWSIILMVENSQIAQKPQQFSSRRLPIYNLSTHVIQTTKPTEQVLNTIKVKQLGTVVIVTNVHTKMVGKITPVINGIDESRPDRMAPRNVWPLRHSYVQVISCNGV